MATFQCFLLLVVVGIVASQEGSGFGGGRVGRSCYIGIGDSEKAIETETKSCKFLENSCQTKVEIGPQGMKVYGECKEFEACNSNANANTRNCYSILQTREESARLEQVCHFCCQGYQCNDAEFISSSLQTRRERLIVG